MSSFITHNRSNPTNVPELSPNNWLSPKEKKMVTLYRKMKNNAEFKKHLNSIFQNFDGKHKNKTNHPIDFLGGRRTKKRSQRSRRTMKK